MLYYKFIVNISVHGLAAEYIANLNLANPLYSHHQNAKSYMAHYKQLCTASKCARKTNVP